VGTNASANRCGFQIMDKALAYGSEIVTRSLSGSVCLSKTFSSTRRLELRGLISSPNRYLGYSFLAKVLSALSTSAMPPEDTQ
jgi:hypothetical protein